MKTETLTITVIKPQHAENWLTQTTLAPSAERIFSKEIYLAPTDTATAYTEVTEQYRQQWLEQQEQEQQEQQEQEI